MSLPLPREALFSDFLAGTYLPYKFCGAVSRMLASSDTILL
jgi:hypothetical protein